MLNFKFLEQISLVLDERARQMDIWGQAPRFLQAIKTVAEDDAAREVIRILLASIATFRLETHGNSNNQLHGPPLEQEEPETVDRLLHVWKRHHLNLVRHREWRWQVND